MHGLDPIAIQLPKNEINILTNIIYERTPFRNAMITTICDTCAADLVVYSAKKMPKSKEASREQASKQASKAKAKAKSKTKERKANSFSEA